jgi:hypothetical protein
MHILTLQASNYIDTYKDVTIATAVMQSAMTPYLPKCTKPPCWTKQIPSVPILAR